jgi:excisionase family DNA binding protein
MTRTTGLGAISTIRPVEKPQDYTARVHRLLAELPRDDFYKFVEDVLTSIDQAAEPAIVDFHTEVTVSEAARLLGVSRPTLYRLIDAGELSTHKMTATRKQMVPLTEIQRLRESREAKDAALAELDAAVSDGLPY